jgi:hypothetical protein
MFLFALGTVAVAVYDKAHNIAKHCQLTTHHHLHLSFRYSLSVPVFYI